MLQWLSELNPTIPAAAMKIARAPEDVAPAVSMPHWVWPLLVVAALVLVLHYVLQR